MFVNAISGNIANYEDLKMHNLMDIKEILEYMETYNINHVNKIDFNKAAIYWIKIKYKL